MNAETKAFAMYLTGHSEETIERLYNSWACRGEEGLPENSANQRDWATLAATLELQKTGSKP